MSITSNFPAIKPTLLLDFANTKQLDPRITFTRASTATYYGTQTAKAEENLVLQSQDFTTTWAANNITITANTQAAPDGTTTAETLDDDVANAVHDSNQAVVTTSGLTYTLSAFLKNGTRQFAILACSGSTTSYATAKFDLSAGTLGSTAASGAAWSVVSSSITSVGNSWYRCTITFVVGTTTGTAVRIGMGTDGTTFTASQRGLELYTGTDATIFAWGAQLEQRSAVTAYTPTTTQTITNYIPQLLTAASGVARFDHNPTTFESLGLLIEESRTNLLTYSEQFDDAAWTKTRSSVTANTIVSPNGTLDGYKLFEDTTASNSHVILQSIVFPASGTVAATIYAKAAERNFVLLSRGTLNTCGVNLTTGQVVGVSGTDTTATTQSVGNGWWRIILVFPSPNITTTINIYTSLDGVFANRDYTGNGYSGIYIWGAQLEAGAFATSYIPTVASQVTRAADAATMTGTNFSSWYNQGEGTMYADAVRGADVDATIATIAIGATTVDRIQLHSTTASEYRVTYRTGNVEQAALTMSSSTNTPKIATTIKTNDLAASINGSAVVIDTSATLATYDTFYIGARSDSAIYWNSTIKKIAYYPLRVTNAQLQGLTS